MDTERRRRARPGMERPVRFIYPPLPLRVSSPPPRAAAQRPPRHYEFPTGFNTYFGPERFQVGELFFAHSRDLVVRLSSSLPLPFSALTTDKTSAHVGVEPAPPAHDPRIDLPGARGVRPRHAPSTHGQRRARRRREPTRRPWRAPQQRARAQLPARENPRAGQSD